ncbi:DUF4276 family protein [Micromonospora aurantiaca (nom. illeg.)]|uniref:DUF4276 family protein n=1 Tax=Micromonospora aurantiaca (nom. illeg.) TaxID=47850 RepID=UPI003F4A7679
MNASLVVASIVEGYGEVEALPILIRRVAGEVFGDYGVEVSKPHRISRGQMVGPTVRRAVEMQSARIAESGGVLVVADSDDDDPVLLTARIADASSNERAFVAVAVREYEAWFLAALDSLRNHRSVHGQASFEGDPEVPRGAKERLESQMVEKYRETIHQSAFSAIMSLDDARRCPSFENFVTQVGRILGS